MYAPKKCPACGSKRKWKRVAGSPAQTGFMRKAAKVVSPSTALPPIPGVNMGQHKKMDRRIHKITKSKHLPGGTYYCAKCHFQMTYDD